MSDAVIDQKQMELFGQKMLDVLNHAGVALMTSLGHRTGLFDMMASLPPATSTQIAEKLNLSERYVREWLGAMVVGGIVKHQPDDKTFYLPPEHAAFLTRAATPNNLAASMQWIAILGGVEDDVLDAFKHGQGVPYSAYHRFHEVMAEESAQSVVAGLMDHVLPLVPGLYARLGKGIEVLDVGCGSGRAMMHLAELFPRSRFAGYDFSAEAVAAAEAEASRRGLKNIRFTAKDVAAIEEKQTFDLITAFDAIHDQAKPDKVLSNIASALRRDGTFLMQDIAGSGHVHQDIGHPVSPFLYTISCMHCMSVSLANGGPGLGAMWGKQKALEMLKAAGFRQVRVESLAHDILNYWYIASVST